MVERHNKKEEEKSKIETTGQKKTAEPSFGFVTTGSQALEFEDWGQELISERLGLGVCRSLGKRLCRWVTARADTGGNASTGRGG